MRKWIRLRTNGKITTLCIKEVADELNIDSTKELEVVVDDFNNMHEILCQLGYLARTYQENKRTSYEFNECSIEIDEWPLIPAYLEIE